MMDREDFQALAWRDFLAFAIHEKDLREAFTRETGRRTLEGDNMMAFTVWATRTMWGWDYAPASFRADAEKWENREAST